MSQPNKSIPIDFGCFRSVTILTDDLIVYQGDLEHDEHRKHDDVVAITGNVGVEADIRPQFITLALSCIPVLLVPSGTSVFAVALYDVFPTTGLVKINIDQIISISDFNGDCAASGVAPAAK